MFYSVDRILGDIAHLMADDQTIIEVPLYSISENIKEGDIVKKQDGQYQLDEEETQKKRKNIQNILNDLLQQEK